MSRQDPSAWSSTVSLEGVDQAIQSLGYRSDRSPKSRLLRAIRDVHGAAADPGSVAAVAAEDLITLLWDVGEDRSALASRRRNLSSLRSSINADLMARYRDGGNPEGVIIGPEYAFTICGEAKDQALRALRDMAQIAEGAGPDLPQVQGLLQRIQDLLGTSGEDGSSLPSDSASLEALRQAVQGLAARVDAAVSGGAAQDMAGAEEEGEVPEEVLDEEDLEDAFDVVDVVEDDEDDTDGPLEEILEEAADGALDEDELEDALDEADPAEEGAVEDLEEVLDEEDLEDAFEDVDVLDDDEDDTDGPLEEILEAAAVEDPEEVLDEEDLEDAFEDVDVLEDDEIDGGGALEEGPEETAGEVLDGWDGVDPEAGDPDPEKARLLAEEFNRSLAAMDRFYNRYVLVPEGTYLVHAFSSNGAVESRVTLSGFYIGAFPVTNAMFELFAEKTGYRTTAERLGWGTVYQGRYRRETAERSGRPTLHVGRGLASTRVEGACWYRPAGPGSTLRGKRNHPVVQVSLEDAMAFAAWSGKRLPTEEEWEAAMRTSGGNPLPWGDAWVPRACNTEEACIGDTSPVDRYAEHANPLGVADGLGNVMEWTTSGIRRGRGIHRVVRGGGWIARRNLTLADGMVLPPDACSNVLGFRCVAY